MFLSSPFSHHFHRHPCARQKAERHFMAETGNETWCRAFLSPAPTGSLLGLALEGPTGCRRALHNPHRVYRWDLTAAQVIVLTEIEWGWWGVWVVEGSGVIVSPLPPWLAAGGGETDKYPHMYTLLCQVRPWASAQSILRTVVLLGFLCVCWKQL